MSLLALSLIVLSILLHSTTAKRQVHIVGAGIGGLTSAHELSLLAEEGTEIHVYEKSTTALGGKARSIPVPHTGTGGRGPLLGEHGYRIFPMSIYHHLQNTMNKIDPNIWEKELKGDQQLMLGRENGKTPVNMTTPYSGKSWFDYVRKAAPTLEACGCPRDEIFYTLERILVLCESCEKRYDQQYDALRFWDFMHADELSEQTKGIFIKLITSGILAADPELASLRTIGKLLVRMFIKYSSLPMVGNLNGPTTLRLIEPWVKSIKQNPNVHFHMGHELTEINSENKTIQSLKFNVDGKDVQVKNSGNDQFVLAIPAEKAAKLIKDNEQIKKDAPSLSNLDKLVVNNQNGLQFFLKKDIPMAYGHVTYSYSKWAVTSISQAQFWDYDWTQVGDGTVKGILSVDVSTWNLPGEPDGPSKGKRGTDVDRDTFIEEVWYQMHKSIPSLIPRNMSDVVHVSFLDPDVAPDSQGKLQGAEPLFINTVNATKYQPKSSTEIGNLYIASDYTQTDFNVASMEAANESGRRAINALLKHVGSHKRSKIYNWPWPVEFLPAQELDCIRYRQGLMPIGWDKGPKKFKLEQSRLMKYMR